MEKAPQNPNEVLTPFFAGEQLVYIPVTEYYVCMNMKPAEAMARIAMMRAKEESWTEEVDADD